MSNWPIYVTANGELAREVLNSVAILLNSTTFATAIKLSIVFAILGTAISYIRGRDITIFARWFIVYFVVAVIMIGPFTRVKVQIFDISDPNRADLTVDDIPYGLGVPASLITSFGHGLTIAFESVFHLPGDFQYNKTGMLFGSRLFRLSTEFNITSPELKSELNQYIKNCIIPDVNILKKYNMGDLAKSNNITSTIFDDTSNTRGVYLFKRETTQDAFGVSGTIIKEPGFVTCKQAAPLLKKYIGDEIKSNSFKDFARRIFTSKNIDDGQAADKLFAGITDVYKEFNYAAASASAYDIATQNLLINALRDGFKAYSAEANDTAGLLNLSNTQAMDRMRMNLATSRNMATYVIPIIHTALLLMMLGLFPLVVILAFQPGIFLTIIKNYFYGLIWIESWPLMFSCLNLIVTFYIKSNAGAIGDSGLTMQNIDLLTLEHSDIANMAGYLMILIPFISGGLVYGMSSVFTSAASHIGGVLQSSATSAASEAATGNIHLGNASWSNVNANKLDTSYLRRGGMITEQLSSGLTRKTTTDGNFVYDTSEVQSRLPVQVRGSEMQSETLSKQSEEAESAGIQDQQHRDHSISNAITKSKTLSEITDNRKSLGEDHSMRSVLSELESANNVQSMAKVVADREGVTQEEAARRICEAYAEGRFGVGVDGRYINLHGNAGLRGNISSEERIGHSQEKDIRITGEEARRFTENLDKLKSFDISKHAGVGQSKVAQLLSGISTDLRNADTYSQQHNIHMAQAQSYREAATFVKQHSNQVDSDYNQLLVQRIINAEGREKAEHIIAGQNPKDIGLLERYANELSNDPAIIERYNNWAKGVNPKEYYAKETKNTGLQYHEKDVEQKYNISEAKLNKLAVDKDIPIKADFDKKYSQTTEEIETRQTDINQKILLDKTGINDEHKKLDAKVKMEQKEGIEKARHPTVFNPQDSFGPGGKLIGKLFEKITDSKKEE